MIGMRPQSVFGAVLAGFDSPFESLFEPGFVSLFVSLVELVDVSEPVDADSEVGFVFVGRRPLDREPESFL
ncbi:MAG: hypothetical protein WBD02_09745 [Acidimicrobiia bacterium]